MINCLNNTVTVKCYYYYVAWDGKSFIDGDIFGSCPYSESNSLSTASYVLYCATEVTQGANLVVAKKLDISNHGIPVIKNKNYIKYNIFSWVPFLGRKNTIQKKKKIL